MFPKRDNMDSSVKPLNVPTLKKDGSNKSDFYIADVLGNHGFVLNSAGYPKSDISLIDEQTNIQAAKAMLEGLSAQPQSLNSGLSDAEISMSHKSKYCQTFSEGQQYIEQQLRYRDMRREVDAVKAASPDVTPPSDSDIVESV